MADQMEAPENGLKLWSRWSGRRGGFRATTFIFVMVGLENMGFVANMVSMFLYFGAVMQFNLSGASTTLTNFLGSAFLLSLVGGFISDTYMTRLNTCLIFGIIEVLGLAMVTAQAHYKSLHPLPCGGKTSCIHGHDAFFFYTSLGFVAIGSGGVRGALPALGADQFNYQEDPKKRNKSVATYFNFMLLSVVVGAAIGVTVIVKVSRDSGWDVGFFVCMLSLLVGFIVLALGKPFYLVRVPGESPLLRVLQVLFVAFRKRKMELPEDSDLLHEVDHPLEDEASAIEKIPHTNQFRWLDKAAITEKGAARPEAWKVCTVTQVEEVKVLTRMMPILLSTILMNTCLAQLNTFSVEQGNMMKLNLGKYVFPPASIPVIPLVFMTVLIPIYEYVFVPLARKLTSHPAGITPLQRAGVGLVLSAISMAVAGFVEVKRRNAFNKEFKQISLFWLSFQFGIFGIADMFTLVGLLDFFYSEAPSGMRSLSTSFTFLSLSFGYFLSSVFVNVINWVTERTTAKKTGWLYGLNLNQNNLDRFYWFLAVLSCINFLNYVYWAKWYKYKTDATEYTKKAPQEVEEDEQEKAKEKEEDEEQDEVNTAERKPQPEKEDAKASPSRSDDGEKAPPENNAVEER